MSLEWSSMDNASLQNASVAFSRASLNDSMADLKRSLECTFNDAIAFTSAIASSITESEPVSVDDVASTKVASVVGSAAVSF